VQTVLVQDEALKRANTRIQELEARSGGAEPAGQGGGFLDNMRNALFGRDNRAAGAPPPSRSSVPPSGAPAGSPWSASPPPPPPQQPGYYGQQPAMAQPVGAGGSFLGTAASTAAGVVGGAMLLNGIRSMFGHSSGGSPFGASAFGAGPSDAVSSSSSSAWGGSAANSDLARDAGIKDVGSGGRDDAGGSGFLGGNDDGKDVGGYADDDKDEGGYADADAGDDDSDFAGDYGSDDSDLA
jgi:uncharacterized protein